MGLAARAWAKLGLVLELGLELGSGTYAGVGAEDGTLGMDLGNGARVGPIFGGGGNHVYCLMPG